MTTSRPRAPDRDPRVLVPFEEQAGALRHSRDASALCRGAAVCRVHGESAPSQGSTDDVVSVPGEVWGPVFAVPADGIAGELVGGFLECGVLAGFTADSYVACVGDVDVAVLEKFAAAQEAGRQDVRQLEALFASGLAAALDVSGPDEPDREVASAQGTGEGLGAVEHLLAKLALLTADHDFRGHSQVSSVVVYHRFRSSIRVCSGSCHRLARRPGRGAAVRPRPASLMSPVDVSHPSDPGGDRVTAGQWGGRPTATGRVDWNSPRPCGTCVRRRLVARTAPRRPPLWADRMESSRGRVRTASSASVGQSARNTPHRPVTDRSLLVAASPLELLARPAEGTPSPAWRQACPRSIARMGREASSLKYVEGICAYSTHER
jgi:hypothetical protein